MDSKKIAEIEARLATPPAPRDRTGTAVAFAKQLAIGVVAARQNGKTWQQIVDDAGDDATFTASALAQAFNSLEKPKRNVRSKAKKLARTAVSLTVVAKQPKATRNIPTEEEQRNLFADAFSSRRDTLSDMKA